MPRGFTGLVPLSGLSRKAITSGGLWMLALPTMLPGRFWVPWFRSSSLARRSISPASLPLAFRDSALAAPLLNARIKSLTQELEVSEGERLSALVRMAEVEAAAKVRHLHPAIDFFMITLDTRWDPKARRIYDPKAEAQEQAGPEAEKRPDPEVGVPAAEDIQEVLPEP
ncbi:hypothetical protein PIB30_109574 [Stylosanthes scabra]|uniref:Uncharacterized protein n=1 Tax=Stylosanthes scabra TaxID=79078 RepID=A0ABU6XYT1_9FABA|nr:hypothetical protein [Stylosanthes scabra]